MIVDSCQDDAFIYFIFSMILIFLSAMIEFLHSCKRFKAIILPCWLSSEVDLVPCEKKKEKKYLLVGQSSPSVVSCQDRASRLGILFF